ncbi:filamentous hemagglutinin N-terminal domain-containing protein, partial [bacterium]|nr:filamentous hemagglutinin N-terminal domain-containing protein [bacterium]
MKKLLPNYRTARGSVTRWVIQILIISMIVPVPNPAWAAGIEVDASTPETVLDQTQNGIDLIRIANPTAGGVSNNKFGKYNVNSAGVIINNSTATGVSQLGGAVYENTNFSSEAARIVLFQVTGSDQSAINGVTEMFGQGADFILSNPNGIQVNGGGFINIPRATFTTGTPFLDANGNLQTLQVSQGHVDIHGFNANTDYFDIIARTMKIHGDLYGGDTETALIAGANTVDYSSRVITGSNPTPTEASGQVFAIDAALLGAIRAGSIRLISTEDGVGVNSNSSMAATVGDVTITSEGDITYDTIEANQDINLAAKGDITQTNYAEANGAIAMHATANIAVTGTISGDSLSQTAGGTINLDNLVVSMVQDIDINASGEIVVSNSTMNAGTTLAMTGSSITSNSNVIANGQVTIQSTSGNVQSSNRIESVADQVSLTASGDVINTGTVLAGTDISATANGQYINDNGITQSSGNVTIVSNDGIANTNGVFWSDGDMLLSQNSDWTTHGMIKTGRDLTIRAITLTNEIDLVASQNIYLDLSGGLVNTTRNILAMGDLMVTANGSVLNTQDMKGNGAFSLTNLASDGVVTNNGTIGGGDSLLITTHILYNTGQVATGGTANITITNLTNTGTVFAKDHLGIMAGGTVLNQEGSILSMGTLTIEADTLINDRGLLESDGDMSITANVLENTRGGSPVLVNTGNSITLAQRMFKNYRDEPGIKTEAQLIAGGHDKESGLWWTTANDMTGVDYGLESLSYGHDGALGVSGREYYHAYDGSFSGYYLLRYHSWWREMQDYTSEASTVVSYFQNRYETEGRLKSGANLMIHVTDKLTNDASLIQAKENITITGGSLYNTTHDLTKTTNINYMNKQHIGIGNHNRTLYAWIHRDRTELDDSEKSTARIYAGGAVSIEGISVVNAGTQDNDVTYGDGTEMSDNTPTDTDSSTVESATVIVVPEGEHGRFRRSRSLDELGGDVALDGSTPVLRYLIETNIDYIDVDTFLGSDYLLSRLGFDTSKTTRLGDAYYETMLVQQMMDQMTMTTTKRQTYVKMDDKAMMTTLFDNAVAAKDSLELAPGISLSADQQNALKSDIVWMEERVVDGETVLVPQLYLAALTEDNIAEDGSIIMGDEVSITTTEEIANSGTMTGKKLTLKGKSITNDDGTLEGDEVDLEADEDIVNREGTIKANTSLAMTAGGDVR